MIQVFLEIEKNKFRIAVDSHGVRGFGTQAIDYDNDGLRDLVVTNGALMIPSKMRERSDNLPSCSQTSETVSNKSLSMPLPNTGLINIGDMLRRRWTLTEMGDWTLLLRISIHRRPCC